MSPKFLKAVAIFTLSGICVAQSGAAIPATKSTSTKSHKATKAPAPKAASQADVDQIQQAIQQLQQQVNDLKSAVQQRDQQLQQAQQQLQQAQAAAQQAQQTAAAAQTTATESATKTDVATVKQTLDTTVATVKEDQKRINAVENPEKIRYKGITLTPGGFIAADTVIRNHTEQTDTISTFNGIPYEGDPRTKLSEFRASARQSRLSLLAEGKAGKAKLTGYYEVDFMGAAPTANENQTTSFNLRQRQLFGQVAFPEGGWTFTAGQTWSLFTPNKKGTEVRNEWIPTTIDAQYIVGYNYGRFYTARLTKSFANKKASFAVSAENPAFLVAGTVPANISGVPGGAGSAGVGVLGNGNNYSTALLPDFIAKVAIDPGYGHYEVKGIVRTFRDHVLNTTVTNRKFGGGLGASAILPIVKSKVDFVAQGSYGSGISRYNDSGNADLYIKPSGAIELVKAAAVVVGVETHPTPKFDWYNYVGTEYQQRSFGVESGTAYGYGSSSANYSKCFANETNFACTAPFKNLNQYTTGFWYRFYKGSYGTLQVGSQYSYTNKVAWSGLNGGAGSPSATPKNDMHMVFTSFRYILP